jgi:4-aminobenzoate N-oxygenase
MIETETPEPAAVDRSTLRRIADAWPQRAAMATSLELTETSEPYDPDLPDYPLAAVPFADHPNFLAAAPGQRDSVLTGLWLGYNERVIATERLIAEPAFNLIMAGVFPGGDDPLVARTVQQSLVDESFHTYMHMMALSRTKELRGIRGRPPLPELITYRQLREVLTRCTEQWERDLAVLVWGAVAETCIGGLLSLLARETTVQPMHVLISRLHLRDESAHGSIVIEVFDRLYARMNPAQRDLVRRLLLPALRAFSAQDPSMLRIELTEAGIPGVEDVLNHIRTTPSGRQLVLDMSGARRMITELGLINDIEFDFGGRR